MSLKFIEFFAGLGGFSACCLRHEVVAAIDIDQAARSTYQLNFQTPYKTYSIESISVEWLRQWEADAWWLSPPCQPFSRRGHKKDRHDPRCRALENLISLIPALRPCWLLLENVTGFRDSDMCQLLCAQLQRCGYQWWTIDICPSDMGWPNRRPRFYLVAGLQSMRTWLPLPMYQIGWKDILDKDFSSELMVEEPFITKYFKSLDRLTELRENEPSACFGSSYGVVSSGAGSYIEYEPGRYRRFSPREVLRLLGFPDSFHFDESLSLKKQWSLAGNSLSLPVVKYLLEHLP